MVDRRRADHRSVSSLVLVCMDSWFTERLGRASPGSAQVQAGRLVGEEPQPLVVIGVCIMDDWRGLYCCWLQRPRAQVMALEARLEIRRCVYRDGCAAENPISRAFNPDRNRGTFCFVWKRASTSNKYDRSASASQGAFRRWGEGGGARRPMELGRNRASSAKPIRGISRPVDRRPLQQGPCHP